MIEKTAFFGEERAGIQRKLTIIEQRSRFKMWSNRLGNLFAEGEHTPVMAVTERPDKVRETHLVNMVQRESKNVLLEPGDTE
jgi:hypothetical protein